jgi:acetyl-CoA C-acetyltransferase
MSALRAVILGGNAVAFGRYRDGTGWRDWVRRAGAAALADAGIGADRVDSLVVASESDFFSLQLTPAGVVAHELGLGSVAAIRVEGGGASGALAVRAAVAQVLSGQARVVLVVGFEQTASHLAADDVRLLYALSFDADLEGMAGASAASLYALSMQLHMARYGTTREQMARVSVKNHGNACDNPLAHKPMRLDVQDVLSSPLVSEPYRRLDCSLISDGAAALVIAHPGVADGAVSRTRIAGSGCASDHLHLGDRSEPHRFAAKSAAARAAYGDAGIVDAARQIQVAEVYDAFTGAELQSLEALGLCAEGEAGPAVAEGRFDVDGATAVNPSGGLIGQGGAPGATGVMQVLGLHRALHAPYRAWQRGLAEAHGGVCTLSVVHVLECE